jgi:hypothetical protein
MFPNTYWSPRYWTGKYWAPTGLVVQLPAVPVEARLSSDSLLALVSLDGGIAAILTSAGAISARLDLSEVDSTWVAEELPPTATLVGDDMFAILGQDALAVQMPVLYVSSEVVVDALTAKLTDGAVISVVSRGEQSVTLKS